MAATSSSTTMSSLLYFCDAATALFSNSSTKSPADIVPVGAGSVARLVRGAVVGSAVGAYAGARSTRGAWIGSAGARAEQASARIPMSTTRTTSISSSYSLPWVLDYGLALSFSEISYK